MFKRERQQRYKTSGGARDLVKVEALVPAYARERILKLAQELRDAHRHTIRINHISESLRKLCAETPRRYSQRIDIDKIVVASINVPFPDSIDASTLSQALRTTKIPSRYEKHLARFLGEISLIDILRFCDRHEIGVGILSKFFNASKTKLAIHRPDIEEHLDELIPAP